MKPKSRIGARNPAPAMRGVRGVEWIIVSQLDERFVVQALNN